MPLVVIFRGLSSAGEPDRAFRVYLTDGEHLLGSSKECSVCLSHPTVSRHHARLCVQGNEITVEDLGSSNGTRIGDRLIRGRTPWTDEQKVSFGGVIARLERVSEEDLQPAVLFEPAPSERHSTEANAAIARTLNLRGTASTGTLQVFALELLPELLRRLDEGQDPVRLAQAVGDALFQSMPCADVEISLKIQEPEDGLVFRATRKEAQELPVRDVQVSNDVVHIKAGFVFQSQTEGFRPLLEVAARLVRLSMNGLEPSIELPPPPHPPLPEPATVVSAVRRIYRDAAHVARGEVSILISGESGTGKEVLARYIHAASPQRDHAFVALNCAALPRDLLEAELFGVEAGVATGVSSRPGKFELAHGGTLFLDEIGDMATETQARILRVIQEGEVFRLGGREPRPAHARLVAATNRDVESMMSSGAFRLDLYHRIADWTVLLPPLRDRQADIPNLAAHFLLSASRSQGHYIAGISRAAMTALESYDWPGNIRQLRSEMTRSALFLDGCQLLQTTHLRPDLRSVTRSSPQTLSERLEAVEREVILQALATLGENVADAATALGLSRSTLYRRMKALDIEIKQS